MVQHNQKALSPIIPLYININYYTFRFVRPSVLLDFLLLTQNIVKSNSRSYRA